MIKRLIDFQVRGFSSRSHASPSNTHFCRRVGCSGDWATRRVNQSNDSRRAFSVKCSPAPKVSASDVSFPCVDQHEARSNKILLSRAMASNLADLNLGAGGRPHSAADKGSRCGPEPNYCTLTTGYQLFHHPRRFELSYGQSLPEFDIAYETWGQLSKARDNAILLHTGLSASSHAKSHEENPAPGWWEQFIGHGSQYPIDIDRYFVICTNVLGSCYGSTGPASLDPASRKPYATHFPILTILDMVRAQFKLLDHLGINCLYASIGSSMGGMQSITAAWMEPHRVGRVVSISGCGRSAPSSIALRYAQRSGQFDINLPMYQLVPPI